MNLAYYHLGPMEANTHALKEIKIFHSILMSGKYFKPTPVIHPKE
jgi:hypothetical protein